MNKCIAVIGAGGKTTLLHHISREYITDGKRVLLVTSTHMMLEADTELSGDAKRIRGRLARDGYCMAGLRVEKEPMKMGPLPAEVLTECLPYADVVLVEADGSRHYSVKYPAAHEPAIPDWVSEVILVMGTFELGHPIKDTVFRTEQMQKALSVSGEEPLTFSHILKIIDQGYRPKLSAMGFWEKTRLLFSERTGDELHFCDLEEAKKRYAKS